MECAKDESGLSPVCVVAHSARERVKDDYVQDGQEKRKNMGTKSSNNQSSEETRELE